MSDTADMPRLEQDDVKLTHSPADKIVWSQFYDMFMNIEQRLPNFDHMLMAMNDYAFQRTSRQGQTNDLTEFCGVIKKGLIDWYTTSINNKMKVPDFIDLTNQVFGDDKLMQVDKILVSSVSLKTNTNKITDTSAYGDASKSASASANTDASISTHTIANTDFNESTNTTVNTDANESTSTSANANASISTHSIANTDFSESTNTSGNIDAYKSTHTIANTDFNESTNTTVNTDASKSASASTNTDASISTHTIANTDFNESTNTTVNTDANESTSTSANADASISTHSITNTDFSESTNTSGNIDTYKSTHTIANTDFNENTNTTVNTDASKSASTSANADASISTHSIANTDFSESTNTSGNTDACESTTADVNKSTAKSLDIDSSIDLADAIADLTNRRYPESIISKRNRSNFFSVSNIPEHTKKYYRHIDSMSALEMSSQSTETNVNTNESFKIIMPNMTEYNTIRRKRLPIDCNIHLGNDYERHWWRQTNDKIILYVDISDLLVELVPNIKVEVTIVGFKVKVRRSNKWIVILSNKFEKAIKKTKWVVNKYRHVKLTINKKEKEFWRKCLVTETRELDTSNFKNHSCTNECNTPKPHKLNLNKTKEESMEEFKKFISEEYDYGDVDTFMEELNAQSAITTKKPQDSALTLNLSVDKSTVKSLGTDFENPSSIKQFSMDSEVSPT